ncbi:MAG: Cerebroside-sulfatase [Planctomycetaceae bacterium]|nr:Cerebroside-sulfatase [Planctomycetaceae bacterium]
MSRNLFYLLAIAVFTGPSASKSAPPNIVFILADDMGYGDVQALNPQSTIPTPNLNRLAAEGMTFTDAHTPSAVCTPTRYGFLTGRYCWRSRLKRGVLNGYSDPLIETDRPTIASFLKSQGYSTGIVGKWHLGLGWVRTGGEKEIDFTKPVTHGPNTLGFDHSYIIPASLDFPPYVYLQNHRVTEPDAVDQAKVSFPAFLREGQRAKDLVMADVLDHLVMQASSFISRGTKDDRPFFLYMPLTAPHKPVLPHPRFRGKTGLGPYGDFVAQVDATVSGVLQAIDKAGVKENTLVIYTSDNGSFMHRRDNSDEPDHTVDETVQAYDSQNHTANYLFRGTKADIWEAGHHVPFFARWPGKVKAGSKCEATLCLTDVFATAADIIERERSNKAAPDSFSFLPALQGEEWVRPTPVIHHSSGGMFAIRVGDWKLVAGNGSGGRQAPRGKPFQKPYGLFNLNEDIAETTNQIDQHEDVAADLEAALEKIRQD